MATISRHNRFFALFTNSQFRFSISFIAISAVVLVLLNLFLENTLRNLSFQSKQTLIMAQERMVAASLTELETLRGGTVGPVMELLDDLTVSRVLVTDESGEVVYDSMDGTLLGHVALYPEIVEALEGNDVFYCLYREATILSHSAIPVMDYGVLKGAVYVMDADATQGALIDALERNIRRISLILELAVLVLSTAAAIHFSNRTRRVIRSIQTLREGDYGEKLSMRGSDEIGVLAKEFDALTDRLQEVEQGRRQFVSDASHELKTPLATIKLLSDSILQNDMDRETTLEFVSDIGEEADRLTRMTFKLLDLSRADSGQEQDREVADVAENVRAAIKILTPLAEMSFVEILPELAEGCTVLAIEGDIHQIVFNLIDNAIKYNREDGKIWVQVHRREEQVELVVADCGIGIPKQEMEHIFARFYRVDKARSRERGGTGLGLSLVHDMVTRNNGTVSVAPRDGGGTCFTVRFPFFAVPEGMKEEAEI